MLARPPSEPAAQHKLLRFAPFSAHSPLHDGLNRFHHPPASARVLLCQLLQHCSPRLFREFSIERQPRREHIDQTHSHFPFALPRFALFLLPEAANVVDRLDLLQQRRIGAEKRRVERSAARWCGKLESLVVQCVQTSSSMDNAGRRAAKSRGQREIGRKQAEAVGVGSRGDGCGENEAERAHGNAGGGGGGVRLACEDLRDFLADGEEGLLDLGAVRGFARERSEDAVERGLGSEGGEKLGVDGGLEGVDGERFVEGAEHDVLEKVERAKLERLERILQHNQREGGTKRLSFTEITAICPDKSQQVTS